jgi:hypothetical protein
VHDFRRTTELFALYQGTTSVVPSPGQNSQGFSPCHRTICTKFQSEKSAGAKAHSFLCLYGTTKVVP